MTTERATTLTITVVRILVGGLFILFGQFKVFGTQFVHGMIGQYVGRYVDQDQAVGFYKVFLAKIVLPHAELFGYIVAWGELLIGFSLILGLWVRAASIAGGVHMLSLTLASWYGPGTDAPLWQYFAAQLDHVGLLLLFVILLAADAGATWGLDGLLRRRRFRPGRVRP